MRRYAPTVLPLIYRFLAFSQRNLCSVWTAAVSKTSRRTLFGVTQRLTLCQPDSHRSLLRLVFDSRGPELVAIDFLDYPLQCIQSRFELFQFRTEADAAVILVSAVASAITGVYIKEHAGNNDNLFLEAFTEETHSIIERFW